MSRIGSSRRRRIAALAVVMCLGTVAAAVLLSSGIRLRPASAAAGVVASTGTISGTIFDKPTGSPLTAPNIISGTARRC